jgi:pimeloyl-ACP methyl ester carboxylesterase
MAAFQSFRSRHDARQEGFSTSVRVVRPARHDTPRGRRQVQTLTSHDGTAIAFDRHGQGTPVILVGGAFQHRTFDPSTSELASLLSDHLSVFHYDRRGRGDSGDTPPYAIEREVEDLEALVDEAGGTARLYASSSGCNLVLTAVQRGVQARKLALWEPNFRVDDSRPPLPDDYVAQLEARIAADRRDDAVEYFLTTAVGMPPEFVAPMRDMPMWSAMEQVAHTLPYDGRIVDGFRLQVDQLKSVGGETLVMAGGQTPWMTAGAQALAEALPNATFRLVEGQGHDVAPTAIAPFLVEFFTQGVTE